VYVGTGNAYHPPATALTDSVLAFQARSGKVLRHYQATSGDVWTLADPTGPDFDFGASPNLFTAPGGRRLVGEGQKSGVYWALDRRTLKPVWHTRVGPGSAGGGIIGSTAYDGTRLYGPDTTGSEVWALDRSGAVSWRANEIGPVNYSPVTVAHGVAYITDFSTFLSARSTSTGQLLANLPLGAPSFGGVSVAGGFVYAAVGTTMSPLGGSVVAFAAGSRPSR
jgi:polyvinyl alcohol dehydrogenase (cytochrome)